MLVSTSLDVGFQISQFTEFSSYYDGGQTDRQPTKNHTNLNVHKVGIELWWTVSYDGIELSIIVESPFVQWMRRNMMDTSYSGEP